MSRMSKVFRIAENVFVLRKRLSGAGAPVNVSLDWRSGNSAAKTSRRGSTEIRHRIVLVCRMTRPVFAVTEPVVRPDCVTAAFDQAMLRVLAKEQPAKVDTQVCASQQE